jgi:hypothetical protein
LLIIGYFYVYQDHRDIGSEKAAFIVSSTELFEEFVNDPQYSEQKYLNQTIEISGVISDLKTIDLTLDDHIFCQFNEQISKELQHNITIKIKGRFIGYDDLLEQVKIDQSSIIN